MHERAVVEARSQAVPAVKHGVVTGPLNLETEAQLRWMLRRTKLHSCKNKCKMFLAAVFLRVKQGRQPRCPSTDKCMNNVVGPSKRAKDQSKPHNV